MLEMWARAAPLFDVTERGDAFGGGRNVPDYRAHLQAYRGFVRGIVVFTAHVFVILALLAYFLV